MALSDVINLLLKKPESDVDDIIEDIVPNEQPLEIKKRNDTMSAYLGYDYVINDAITIYQPTVGSIIEVHGEESFYSMLTALTAIPSDMKSILFDMGRDYMEVSDFELFTMLSRQFTVDETRALLGELDLQKFDIYKRKDDGELIMYNKDDDITIDTNIYLLMVTHIRNMFGIKPKVENAANEYTKKAMIMEDRDKRASDQNKEFKSILHPMISFLVNSEGFKYNLSQVKDIGICELMDSARRISAIIHTKSLLQGIYAGNIDAKNNKSELNFMRELI